VTVWTVSRPELGRRDIGARIEDVLAREFPDRRTRLDLSHRCELYTGRRDDVRRLRARLEQLL